MDGDLVLEPQFLIPFIKMHEGLRGSILEFFAARIREQKHASGLSARSFRVRAVVRSAPS